MPDFFPSSEQNEQPQQGIDTLTTQPVVNECQDICANPVSSESSDANSLQESAENVVLEEQPNKVEDKYWGLSPDFVTDFPGKEGIPFKNAIDVLCLPKIICGQKYEHVVRFFTETNKFKDSIQIVSVQCINRNDFYVELNPTHDLLYLYGTPLTDDDIEIRFCYRIISKNMNSLNSTKGATELYHEKKFKVQSDPLTECNSSFKQMVLDHNLSPLPADGQVGKPYKERLDVNPQEESLREKIEFSSLKITPECGITVTEESPGVFIIEGIPTIETDLNMTLEYILSHAESKIQDSVNFFFARILPDEAKQYETDFHRALEKKVPARAMAGAEASFENSLTNDFNSNFIDVTGAELESENGSFKIDFDLTEKTLRGNGVPLLPGQITAKIKYRVKAHTPYDGEFSMPILNVTPDPKTLWKNLPTDSSAPYQTDDTAIRCIQAGERVIVAASKRGRSHAHEGKFRDDCFMVDYIPETGWYIVVVSDGAGSAKYSRAGSKITCETFCECMKNKLSDSIVNQKIDGMTDEDRENTLKNVVLNAAYQGLAKIDAEAKSQNYLRKDFSATLLGYVMKKFGDQWLIVSIGIGDGIISLMEQNGKITLLSEPDGGEFVGQTRFITMNEVWQDNPIKRVRTAKVPDFEIIMSMTDGVSDPKFETDNNLKNEKLWADLFNDIKTNVPLDERSEISAQKLCDWLDFWARGNHDDRTIVLVY